MEVHTIPVDELFLIYRPLLKLAFVGNRAMADLAEELAEGTCVDCLDIPYEVRSYLDSIGFLAPDPPPPSYPSREFKPTTAVLLMTNRCNLRCIYCYANAGIAPPKDLSFELAKTLIDTAHQNAVDRGAKSFALTTHGGGEPTHAWALLKNAVAYARGKSLPCRVTMVSNGIWSSKQRDWIINNLNSLTISLDGGPTTQNYQRPLVGGRNSFEYVMKTVKILDEDNFNYGIRMTALPPFKGILPEDIRYLCEETNCQVFHVEPAFNTHRGGHKVPTKEELRAFINAYLEAFAVAREYGRKLRYSGARPEIITTYFCSAPYGGLIVTPEGQLTTCFEVTDSKHPLVEKSVIGMVEGDDIQILDAPRHALLDYLENKQDTQCQSCFCRWHCAGDCYVRTAAYQDGELSPIQERCYLNRELTKHLLMWKVADNGGVWQGRQASQPPPEPMIDEFLG